MRAELEKLNSRLEAMSREELILSIRRLLEECSEKDTMLEVNSAVATEMSVQYQQIRDENTALKKENRELLRQNRDLTDQLQMRTKDLFGRRSEKTSGIADAILDGAPEDPLSETSDGQEQEDGDTLSASELQQALNSGRPRRHKAGKKAGKRKADLDRLPTKTCYKLDIEKYNRIYGEGRWRIAFWRREDTVESIHISKYHKCLFHPVISVGLEHELACPDPCGKLLPGSLASPSLVSELMYQKACLCLPSYRMEADLQRSGVPLSRQTITNWINRFSHDYLATAADYMASLLVRKRYNQCDETTYEVIKDGRKAGAKGYVWVHTTSELDQGHPLIVYRFELTRSTDHLRRFYGDTGYKGCITSDAYCSYDTLAKEYPDIYGSGCLMHVRRRFYQASLLIKAAGKPSEAFRDLPEMKALMMIDEINEAEQPLKSVSPEERLRIRQSLVKGRVGAFYSYIKTLDAGDPSFSEKLRDAIQYALNHEEKIRRFLDDPMIPVDNGFVERSIKGLATARKNWMFSYSITGAEAIMILFTLVETAKANQAHPYYYLKYLLETLPGQKITKDNPFLDDCMPWSEKYRAYEAREKKAELWFLADQAPPERPKTPRKKDQCA